MLDRNLSTPRSSPPLLLPQDPYKIIGMEVLEQKMKRMCEDVTSVLGLTESEVRWDYESPILVLFRDRNAPVLFVSQPSPRLKYVVILIALCPQ